MDVMNYKQEKIEKILTVNNRQLNEKTVLLSGERNVRGDEVKLVSRPIHMSEEQLTQNTISDFVKASREMSDKLSEFNVSFTSQITSCNEIVTVNDNLQDVRSFRCCRSVISGKSFSYVTEFPVKNFSDYFYITFHPDERLMKFLSCSYGDTEKFEASNIPIVFSSMAAGYLAHEIIGHMLEEDVMAISNLDFSKLSFATSLEVKDSIAGYENFLGLSKYDDMGHKIEPITLIKNGLIHNNISIKCDTSFNKHLYGMARRQSYKYPVLPRMRNTFINPYECKSEEDIIRDCKYGFYIMQVNSGSCVPLTLTYFLNGTGFFINSGEVSPYLCKFVYKGNVITDLRHIEIIGSDLKIFSSNCVKANQFVRVCMGGPTLRLIGGHIHGIQLL